MFSKLVEITLRSVSMLLEPRLLYIGVYRFHAFVFSKEKRHILLIIL
jgi:hypothetical protein